MAQSYPFLPLDVLAMFFALDVVTLVFVSPPACRNSIYDYVFLLDGSTSVGPGNFELIKDFVSRFVGRINIGTNANRVGVVTFGSNVESAFYLNRYGNVNDLRNGINNVRYLGGSSNIAEAFRQARTDQLTDFVSLN